MVPLSRTPSLIIITGAMAAGKSTVAQLLAERLPRSVHLRGDVFRRMIVNGRADMAPGLPVPSAGEASAQLRLRYHLAMGVAEGYCAAGFDVVWQDVIVGPELSALLDRLRHHPTYLVVLAPDVDTLRGRELARAKGGDRRYDPAELDRALRTDSPRRGYWVDTSAQSPEQTVEDLLTNLARARVRTGAAERRSVG